MFDDVNSQIDDANERHERILELREKLRGKFNNLSPERQKLLERVIRNGEEMEDMPPEHINALNQIDPTQPRSILALNLLEETRARENGERAIRQWRANEEAGNDDAGSEGETNETPDAPLPPPSGPTFH